MWLSNKCPYVFWILPFFLVSLGRLCIATAQNSENASSQKLSDLKCWVDTNTPYEPELTQAPAGSRCSIAKDLDTQDYEQSIDLETTSNKTCYLQGSKWYCKCSVNGCNQISPKGCLNCLMEATYHIRKGEAMVGDSSERSGFSDLQCYHKFFDKYNHDPKYSEIEVRQSYERGVCYLGYDRITKTYTPYGYFIDHPLQPNEYQCIYEDKRYGLQGCVCNEDKCNTPDNPKCQKCFDWINEPLTYVSFGNRELSNLSCHFNNEYHRDEGESVLSYTETVPEGTVCAIFYIKNQPYQTNVDSALAKPGFQCITLFGSTLACVCDTTDCNTIDSKKCEKCFER